MRFRLLGLLEVSGDDGPISIPAGRESQLLALLLLHRNEPLSTDRIVEELWGDRPPENAAKSVHIYVSRLRKALRADRIETTPAGYRIRVAPDELDIDDFEAIADRAQAALATGDAEKADELLGQALSLWSGDPLADFTYEAFVQEAHRRLLERRNVATADRVDARLALGRPEGVIAELQELISAEPLWERPRGQLMLALYRAGRQTDALDVARATRALFDDELGLEPSATIRDLELQILNHDPELGAPAVPKRQVERGQPLLLVAAGAALIIGAFVAALFWTANGRSKGLAPVPANSLAAIDPRSNVVTAVVPIGSSPISVAVGPDGVWVANSGDQTIALVDPKSKLVITRFGLGAIPGQIAVGRRTVWVTTAQADRGELLELDPAAQTIQTRAIPVGNDDVFATPAPSTLTTIGDHAWANSFHSQLVDVAPGDSSTPTLHRLGPQHSVDGIAYGAGSLWIASSVDDQVLRVDPMRGRIVQRVPIAAVTGRRIAGPYGITFGFGSIWVTATLEDRVIRIDPRSNAVVTTIPAGVQPTAITTGSGAVWVIDTGSNTITRIDPKTNRAKQILVGQGLTGIAASRKGPVWVTVAGGPSSTPPAAAGFKPLPRSSCGPVLTGEGKPDLLIVSDLPTSPGGIGTPPDPVVIDMRRAILETMREHRFRAGRFRVAYQACNDAPASTGATLESCAANARRFAAANVSAVIGPFNSRCAKVELPILDSAPRGPIAVASPSATYVGLTHGGPATAVDEPGRYYPVRTRNFVRLVSPDDAQGAGLAQLAEQLGAKSIFLLDDGDPTAEAMAAYVGNAATRLGMRLAGARHWSSPGSEQTALAHFAPLAAAVAATHPDAVVLTGCVCSGGPPLVVALRHALGRQVPLLGSDNFTFATDMSSGPQAMLGMYLTSTGAAASQLPAEARAFLRRTFPGRPLVDVTSLVPAAAVATEAVLTAIAASNGAVTSVTSKLTHSTFFDPNGDPTRPTVSVLRISAHAPAEPHADLQGVVADRTILARPSLARPLPIPR